jgi:hypothetical protein
MNIKTFVAAAALSLSCAAGASAADKLTATLETPVAASKQIIAGNVVWTCEGATCSTTAPSSRAVNVRACKDLAKSVGAFSTFKGQRTAIEGDELANCNTAAAKTAQPAPTQTAAN